jgi:hypothetical protein
VTTLPDSLSIGFTDGSDNWNYAFDLTGLTTGAWASFSAPLDFTKGGWTTTGSSGAGAFIASVSGVSADWRIME